MMKLKLIGFVGNNSGVREAGKTEACNLSVAVTDRNGETTWVKAVFFGGAAKVAAEHAPKGRQIYIEGRPEISIFERSDETIDSELEVIVDDFEFLGKKTAEDAQPEYQSDKPRGTRRFNSRRTRRAA